MNVFCLTKCHISCIGIHFERFFFCVQKASLHVFRHCRNRTELCRSKASNRNSTQYLQKAVYRRNKNPIFKMCFFFPPFLFIFYTCPHQSNQNRHFCWTEPLVQTLVALIFLRTKRLIHSQRLLGGQGECPLLEETGFQGQSFYGKSSKLAPFKQKSLEPGLRRC